MKDIAAVFFAALFVLLSLVSLILAERNPETKTSVVINDQERISELGLRFAFKR
jgi:hypothetical protein